MKEKLVRQFRCEFCNKKMYQRPAMAKHELHCTMNPYRECRVCDMIGEEKKPTEDLIRLFPVEPEQHNYGESYKQYADACEDALIKLKKTTSCPACILSVLRLSKTISTEFDYKKEMAGIMEEVNRDRCDNYARGY